MNVAFEAYGGRSPANFPQFPGVLAGPGFPTTGGGSVPVNALTLNGQPITLNGQNITLTKAA